MENNSPTKRSLLISTNNEKCEDRFSSLPECILFMIVSLIPFKDAARLSCLGHGWSRAWRAMQKLEFNERFFATRHFINFKEERENRRNNFIKFVRSWIQQCEERVLDELKLVLSSPQRNYSDVKNLIQYGLEREVKHLDLDFSNPFWESGTEDGRGSTYIELPFYEGYEKLESLRLFSCYIDAKKVVSFTSLKVISLGWITMDEDSSIQTLISNCPSLESLSLINVYNVEAIVIFAGRLKKLVIENCYNLTCVALNAPCLESFVYSGRLIRFIIDRVNAIQEVALDFGQQRQCDLYHHGHDLYYLLNDLKSTIAITVCSYMLQTLSHPGTLTLTGLPLANVRNLTINCGLEAKEYNGISFFLHSCPLLEVLTINVGIARFIENFEAAGRDHPFFNLYGKSESYVCLKNTLKVVVVKGFKGSMNEYFLLQYLCNYGQVLEKIYVYVPEEMKPFAEFIAFKLNNFHQASPVHQLISLQVEY